jgi:hypothetical protein
LGLLLEELKLVFLFMIVFGSLLIIFFLFQEAKMFPALDLTPLTILPFGDSVLES